LEIAVIAAPKRIVAGLDDLRPALLANSITSSSTEFSIGHLLNSKSEP
jgi:hypothetical protein